MEQVIFITGPTASGKTKLAIELANKIDGEIISCDSMQIYKYLNIGTAKPTKEEQSKAPHYMIDIVEPNEDYTVADYVQNALKIIDDIKKRNKTPIIVGGTGLYVKSLIYPYTFMSSKKDDNIRNYYKNLCNEKGSEFLHNLLKEKDASSAEKIHPNDTKRIIRALEIFDLTGKTKEEQTLKEITPRFSYKLFVLSPNREELYKKINQRVENMFSLGLEKEITNLLDKNLITKNSQSMQAIGYKEFFDYFDGKINLEELKEKFKQNSRHYAKRQLTFFRSFKDAIWLQNPSVNDVICLVNKDNKESTKA